MRKQQVDAIMNRYHKSTGDEQGGTVVRYVEQVDFAGAQPKRNLHVQVPESVFFGKVYGFEIRAERSELKEMTTGSEKEIMVVGVYGRKTADEVPDMRSNAELVNLSDVDGDPHDFLATGIAPLEGIAYM